MTLSPIATQLINQGYGFEVVLAVYELVRRFTGQVNPARRDPGLAWALAIAEGIKRNGQPKQGNPVGVVADMESCVYVVAAALPPDYQDLWVLQDAETVLSLSQEAIEGMTTKRKPQEFFPNVSLAY